MLFILLIHVCYLISSLESWNRFNDLTHLLLNHSSDRSIYENQSQFPPSLPINSFDLNYYEQVRSYIYSRLSSYITIADMCLQDPYTSSLCSWPNIHTILKYICLFSNTELPQFRGYCHIEMILMQFNYCRVKLDDWCQTYRFLNTLRDTLYICRKNGHVQLIKHYCTKVLLIGGLKTIIVYLVMIDKHPQTHPNEYIELKHFLIDFVKMIFFYKTDIIKKKIMKTGSILDQHEHDDIQDINSIHNYLHSITDQIIQENIMDAIHLATTNYTLI